MHLNHYEYAMAILNLLYLIKKIVRFTDFFLLVEYTLYSSVNLCVAAKIKHLLLQNSAYSIDHKSVFFEFSLEKKKIVYTSIHILNIHYTNSFQCVVLLVNFLLCIRNTYYSVFFTA